MDKNSLVDDSWGKLPERLRARGVWFLQSNWDEAAELMFNAAAEIESLRIQIIGKHGYRYEVEILKTHTEELRRACKELRNICAEVYQFAGSINAPVEILDNLSAGARGETPPHNTILPFVPKRNLLSRFFSWIINDRF